MWPICHTEFLFTSFTWSGLSDELLWDHHPAAGHEQSTKRGQYPLSTPLLSSISRMRMNTISPSIKYCIINRWGFSSSSPWDSWLLSSFMRSSTGYHHYHHVENSCSVLLLFRDHKHMVFNCTSHGPITLPQMPTGDQTENIAEKQSPGSGDSGQWGHPQKSSPAKAKTFWPFWSTRPLVFSSWPTRLNSGESLTAVEKSQILFFLVFFLQPLRPATMKKS